MATSTLNKPMINENDSNYCKMPDGTLILSKAERKASGNIASGQMEQLSAGAPVV